MIEPRKKTILIVDDTPENIKILAQILKSDYRLVVAKSGPEALKIAGAAEPPDLILLDIMMPEMDGWQVYEKLRGFSTVPVIFLTADYNSSNRHRAIDVGAVMIRKDVKPLELGQKIQHVLQTLPD